MRKRDRGSALWAQRSEGQRGGDLHLTRRGRGNDLSDFVACFLEKRTRKSKKKKKRLMRRLISGADVPKIREQSGQTNHYSSVLVYLGKPQLLRQNCTYELFSFSKRLLFFTLQVQDHFICQLKAISSPLWINSKPCGDFEGPSHVTHLGEAKSEDG